MSPSSSRKTSPSVEEFHGALKTALAQLEAVRVPASVVANSTTSEHVIATLRDLSHRLLTAATSIHTMTHAAFTPGGVLQQQQPSPPSSNRYAMLEAAANAPTPAQTNVWSFI